MVLEFQLAGTGLAVALVYKRSSIECCQEYYRETATTCTLGLYTLPMTVLCAQAEVCRTHVKLFRVTKQLVSRRDLSYFARENKLFSWAKQLVSER